MEVAPADWEMTQQPQAQMKKAQSRGQEQWHHPLLARQNTALETAWDQVASLVNRRGKRGNPHFQASGTQGRGQCSRWYSFLPLIPPPPRRDPVTPPQEAGQALTSVMRGGWRCPHPCSWPASGALRPLASGIGPMLPQCTCHLRGRCHHRLPCMNGCESHQHGVHGCYGPA